jgi:hypothetical protein
LKNEAATALKSNTDSVKIRSAPKSNVKSVWQSRTVWGILLAALLLRILIVVYYTPRQGWTGDVAYYLQWGKALADGGLQGPLHHRLPGMTALVAAGCRLGDGGCQYVPLFLFAVCGTAAATGLWCLLLPTLRPTARIPALFLLQFCVSELEIMVFRLLPDLPALTLGIGATCLLVAAQRPYRPIFGYFAGILLGASLYLRSDYVVVLLCVAFAWSVSVYRELGIRRVLAVSLPVVATALLLALPWGVWNYRRTGDAEFRGIGGFGAGVLWTAFNDNRNLDWYDIARSPSKAVYPRDDEMALKEAQQFLRAHPFDSLFLMGSRIISHISPMPQSGITAAANQFQARPLRWVYRGATMILNESWIVMGLIALVLGCRRFPLPLVLLAAFTGSRLAFPGAFMPDGGRYALILVPFLSCCTIWWLGGSERQAVRPSWFGIAIAILAVQAWFVFRWGLWR